MGAPLTIVCAPAAQADVTTVFNDGDTPVPCAPKADGIRVCQGVTETFDGVTTIDVNVLPPAPASGDGNFPASASSTAGAARSSASTALRPAGPSAATPSSR